MKSEITYRKLKPEEVEIYHTIRLDCLKNYPENFGLLYEEELKANNFKFDKIITAKSSTDFLMGAFFADGLIGICGFIQEKKQKKKHIGDISGMYVITSFSGEGIGAHLIKATISKAFEIPELEMITLAVAASNIAALNLYKKIGFKEYGRLNNYFKYEGYYETQVFMVLKKEEYFK